MPTTPAHNRHDHDGDRHQACYGRRRLDRVTPYDDGRGLVVFSRARLRAWRHVTGTTYAALATAAGSTVEHVAACERGASQPDDAMITAWAGVLGCQPDQLRSACPDGPSEYWNAASQAMPPMTADDLAVVASYAGRTRNDAPGNSSANSKLWATPSTPNHQQPEPPPTPSPAPPGAFGLPTHQRFLFSPNGWLSGNLWTTRGLCTRMGRAA
jgi:transcriptional regulator with XRE-family HTH domain